MEMRPFEHASYLQFLREGRLMASRCRDCGQVCLPPRALCPNCHGTNAAWIEMGGTGSLLGWTTINVGLPAMTALGYSRENPYCVGVVRLDEGPAISARMVGVNITGPEGACPDEIAVGMRVKMRLITAGEEITLAFAPS